MIDEETDLYIREDRNSGRVWLLNNVLYPVMDLSLVKGNVFHFYNPYTDDSLATVDSVFIIDGRKHIRLDYQIQLGDTQIPLEFIEGIGPNAGFLYQTNSLDGMFSDSQLLLCAYKDTSRIYKNDQFVNDDCTYKYTRVNDIRIDPNNPIHPNPASDFIEIDHKSSSEGILTIYNMTGVLVQSQPVYATGMTRIDVSSLKDGLYLVLFRKKDGSKIMGKFIKLGYNDF